MTEFVKGKTFLHADGSKEEVSNPEQFVEKLFKDVNEKLESLHSLVVENAELRRSLQQAELGKATQAPTQITDAVIRRMQTTQEANEDKDKRITQLEQDKQRLEEILSTLKNALTR